jgi:hypothetical protein
MAKPKGVRDLARSVQGGALRYLKAEHEKGRPMSTIWAELFEEDKFKAMDMIIRLMPKELLIEQSTEHVVSFDMTGIPPDLLREAFAAHREPEGSDTGVQAVH